MTLNNHYLNGMEAEIKTINNVITSTLKGSGKLVAISGEENCCKSSILKFTQDILNLKPEVFSCFIKGEELNSYDYLLKHILKECNARYPSVYKKICGVQNINLELIEKGLQKVNNIMILDILELIVDEYPLVFLIEKVDALGSQSLSLLESISCFIPYNRLTIICTIKNADNITFIEESKMNDFYISIFLTPSEPHEITDSYHIISLFNKSGFPSNDINFIIKLFLRGSIQLMNGNISQMYGLIQYLNDDDSLNYYEAMAYYHLLLLKKGRRHEALILSKEMNRKLSIKSKGCENNDTNKIKFLRCFILGNYYCYVNKGNAAISIMEKGLNFVGKDFLCEYRIALGFAYMSVGDWTNAEKNYLRAYESSIEEGTFLPHLHISLFQLYNFKCEFNRASYYYKILKDVKFKLKNDFIETLLDLLLMPISSAVANNESINISYEMLMNKLLNKPYWGSIPLYQLSYLRLYIIAGDHLFRCKDYKNSMKLYEKALINYDDTLNEPYMKDFINIRIMACRSMLGFRAGKFVLNLNLDYKTQTPFQKYMLCSIFFFAHLVYLSSDDSIKAKKYLIRSIRYARSSGNLIYKCMGYFELYKIYSLSDPKKAKLCHKKYLESMSAMGISPNNIPYTYADSKQQDDERINCILDFIKGNYRKDISLSMLSNEIHLSHTHICHLIKEKTGYTFKEILLHTRIQEARKMLTGTVLNISDIAAAVGFSSSKYFCQVFKETCGFTPNSYRKKHHNHNIKEFVR